MMKKQEYTDHDSLFKQLLTVFFVEFVELFFPKLRKYLDPNSITFLDKEVFTDVIEGERYETDIIVQARFAEGDAYFLIHIENQSYVETAFDRRMFGYFARLYEKFHLPVYPIVVLSYDRPQKAAINYHQVKFPDFEVLKFNYRVIQLNRLNWRDFLERKNPVASALMAKMKIAPEDRPRVKVECLRLLVTLRLDPARMHLISGFVDSYLKLNEVETRQFAEQIAKIRPEEKEEVMQIVTSWMEEGIEIGLDRGREEGRKEGREEGREEGKLQLLLLQLTRRFGELQSDVEARISKLTLVQLDALGLDILDFESLADLTAWLAKVAENSEDGNSDRADEKE
ncbi:MAG: DUF4351 domain-containing protein [Cyanobacteria bacterium P01_E01_bin.42]